MARSRPALIWFGLLSVAAHCLLLILGPGANGPASALQSLPLQVSLATEIASAELAIADSGTDEVVPESAVAEPDPPPVPAAEAEGIEQTEQAQGAEIVPVPAEAASATPVYRNVIEMHQRPIPLARIDLTEMARQYPGVSAAFVLRISVQGSLDEIEVRPGSDPSLSAAFMTMLHGMRFVPGKIAGRPVPGEMVVQIGFPGNAPSDVSQLH